ncbi:MAG: FKBP-type peptidyl-prolyl cis-trans isomerase [Deltaproteobacteria bacterium]|jgi:peptidylprolyl isomerase|nr:FKBP-type peptidyl-prolyl cis-trans isomerase [Deltaproteobacteria bacterium]MDH3775085.1 FKBP-type peptidyl-prolyl cis-trans isomerase [Deltaproteobacteria bacterium]MDH3852469.1 FKBP-type peptidyl-prolyl cis-trans isomerase [Deltaproteobacteria bacterium]MDH3963275.1 FKBP-type peptidyl-prolyl cis-trans isomerase [Deltaproteobacteria bacterium]PNV85710.1 MAG: peptidylprolyl isomerase [Desulfobacteraceae bacterium]
MSKAKEGDRVKVYFTGTLEDGTIFGQTHEDEPFEFNIGEKSVLPKFESAVVGMKEGENKTILIAPEDAYGPRDEERMFTVEKSEIPDHITPEIGKKIQVQTGSGEMAILTVLEVSEDKVTFDANDPLAGEELTFEIELLEIVQTEPNE